jgi:hypothetical protein
MMRWAVIELWIAGVNELMEGGGNRKREGGSWRAEGEK